MVSLACRQFYKHMKTTSSKEGVSSFSQDSTHILAPFDGLKAAMVSKRACYLFVILEKLMKEQQQESGGVLEAGPSLVAGVSVQHMRKRQPQQARRQRYGKW